MPAPSRIPRFPAFMLLKVRRQQTPHPGRCKQEPRKIIRMGKCPGDRHTDAALRTASPESQTLSPSRQLNGAMDQGPIVRLWPRAPARRDRRKRGSSRRKFRHCPIPDKATFKPAWCAARDTKYVLRPSMVGWSSALTASSSCVNNWSGVRRTSWWRC